MKIIETLRKYPPALILVRKAINDYKIPGSKHTIPAGTQIMIPSCSIQNDERYFDNPVEFRPERFSQTEIEKRPNFVFTPFGKFDLKLYCISLMRIKFLIFLLPSPLLDFNCLTTCL